MEATLTFDGASRGNPGPAAYGYVLTIDGREVEGSETLGQATNNEAEYHALKAGVEAAVDRDVTSLEIRGDSELIVKQVRGEYSVRAPNLLDLYDSVMRLLEEFDDWRIRHVDRELNTAADELANRALDSEEA